MRTTTPAFLAALFLVFVAAPSPVRSSDDKVTVEPGDAGEDDVEKQKGIAVSFGGQYRINGYLSDNGVDGEENQTAARVRIRQGVDVQFDERFKTHFQFQLNHTSGNQGLSDASLRVRHAVLDYTFRNGAKFQAGIVPLADQFGDTLFSADWDYNPVALAFTIPAGKGNIRLFAGNLREGSEIQPDDDIVHFEADYSVDISARAWLGLSGLAVQAPDAEGASRTHGTAGLSAKFKIGGSASLNALVMVSTTSGELLGASSDADGLAGKVELTVRAGPGDLGIMFTHATGDADGTGFLPVMSLIGFNGYWGYTGILTVQGPTDTGFDGDSVNISNNGYGMSSVQAKYAFPMGDSLSGYLAAGWFGNTNADHRDSTVGVDLIAMGKYKFNDYLALELGAAVARLEDSLSGYFQGARGEFNQAAGVSRDKKAGFFRLQVEF